MALALLDLVGLDASKARLRIDTGINRYYRVEIGRAKGTRDGFDWIDDVARRTPVASNVRGGGLLNTWTEVTVAVGGLASQWHGVRQPLFAQLFSFRTADGRGMSFSPVVALERAMAGLGPNYESVASLGMSAPDAVGMVVTPAGDDAPTDGRARSVACQTCDEQFTGPTLDDLLAQIVQVAAPTVLQMLGGQSGGGAPANSGLDSVFHAIVSVLPGLLGSAGAGSSSAPVSRPLSLGDPDAGAADNRFHGDPPLADAMIFGIDDALLIPMIGQVAGPLLNALPQLMNAANAKRIELEKSRNALMGGIVSDVQRRLMLQQVLNAQQSAPAGQAADLGRLAQLLQQAAPPSAPAGAAAAPAGTPAVTQSLTVGSDPAAGAAARAVATFVTAPPVQFAGGSQVVYSRGHAVTVPVKFVVGEPVPKSPLPKAIITVLLKDPADQRIVAQQVVKQKQLAPGATIPVTFSVDQLAGAPTGRKLAMLAEIRWRTTNGQERKALGSQDVVLTDRYFVKSRGAEVGPERELVDMARFRPFWDKVYESVTAKEGQTLWGLDVNMRFTVLLTAKERHNGLMQTRLSNPPNPGADDLRVETSGKMKAGIECSVDELAKLTVLWDGEPLLDADHLAAFRTDAFAKRNASDAVTPVKLSGARDVRGLVWVVPVFRLVDHTLGLVNAVDNNGQVTQTDEEHAKFPLPVAIRILALKSGESVDLGGSDEPAYHFDGYRIDRSTKVGLTPHG